MTLRACAAFLIALATSLPAFAQEPIFTALSFQSWKDQQVLEAQNKILRASARLSQIKNGTVGSTESKETSKLPTSRVKKTADGDPIVLAERDLKRAQESMEAASNLQLDDYITVYLPTLQDQPEAASKLIDGLSKEELAEITKGLLRKGAHAPDAKRNARGITVEGLTASARGR